MEGLRERVGVGGEGGGAGPHADIRVATAAQGPPLTQPVRLRLAAAAAPGEALESCARSCRAAGLSVREAVAPAFLYHTPPSPSSRHSSAPARGCGALRETGGERPAAAAGGDARPGPGARRVARGGLARRRHADRAGGSARSGPGRRVWVGGGGGAVSVAAEARGGRGGGDGAAQAEQGPGGAGACPAFPCLPLPPPPLHASPAAPAPARACRRPWAGTASSSAPHRRRRASGAHGRLPPPPAALVHKRAAVTEGYCGVLWLIDGRRPCGRGGCRCSEARPVTAGWRRSWRGSGRSWRGCGGSWLGCSASIAGSGPRRTRSAAPSTLRRRPARRGLTGWAGRTRWRQGRNGWRRWRRGGILRRWSCRCRCRP